MNIKVNFEFAFTGDGHLGMEFSTKQLCSLLKVIDEGGSKKMNKKWFHSTVTHLTYSSSSKDGKKYELKRNSVRNEISNKLMMAGVLCN